MTRIEELWLIFERRVIPPQVPPTPRYAITNAYHAGAYDMLCAVNAMQATTPAEATAYLQALEKYCLEVLQQKRTPARLQ